jgi:glutathione S-transferase
MSRRVTLFHSPNTRSSGALTLLHELGADFELSILNMKAGENRQPPYLAVNPLGKVPAVRHDGAVITEQVAVFLYLADLWTEARLAPAIGDPLRGPYLRWMAIYGSSFEPALVDKAMQRDGGKASMSVYGDYDTLIKLTADQLAEGPWLLGSRFTAADVLWGIGLAWTTSFGIVPKLPVFIDYVSRVTSRPAAVRVREFDAHLAAEQAATAAKG